MIYVYHVINGIVGEIELYMGTSVGVSIFLCFSFVFVYYIEIGNILFLISRFLC